MNTKTKLSPLWIVVMFNMLFADIFNPEFAVNFKINESGEIAYFTMNLQSEAVEFIKKLNE